jgi:hypothetical protein
MIAVLQELASLLARDSLTVDQIIAKLGTVLHDYGSNILVTTSNLLFKEANVVREINLATLEPSNAPAHVILTPAEPVSLKILARAFGEYKNVPAKEKIPSKVIFYLEMPGQPYSVALIAEVENSRALKITLRRDVRL